MKWLWYILPRNVPQEKFRFFPQISAFFAVTNKFYFLNKICEIKEV